MNVKLIGINGRYSHSSLSLFYVRNQLENHCPFLSNIEIIQFTINDSYYETLIRLTSPGFRYIFFSAYVWNSDRICSLVRDIKRVHPKCCIVVGGPQAEAIGQIVGNGLCTVVIGEVERLGSDFYHDLASNRMMSRYGSHTPKTRSHYPFPYRSADFETHLANRNIYYESSRGCPFACIYCLSSVDKAIFHKDVEEVKEELNRILEYRPKVVRFVDRTFNDQPTRALAIWKFLANKNNATTYHFEISPYGFSEEIYQFLESVPAGLFQFEIGVQSTNEKTLKAIKRPINPEEACEVISRLAELATIHLHIDLILGLPFDSKSSFLDAFSNVFHTGAHYIQMGLLKILPDTPLHKVCGQYGYQYCDTPPYEILSSQWMDHKQLSEMYWFGECVEKFLNNRYFPSIWMYLRNKRDDIGVFFYELMDVCHSRSFFQLAPTQELMCEMVLSATEKRNDQPIIKELLRHDWLRCGHRFLPECLSVIKSEQEHQAELRKSLFKRLPNEIEGIYTEKNRNHFLKKSIFFPFSGIALKTLGYSEKQQPGILSFTTTRDASIFRLNRVVLLPDG